MNCKWTFPIQRRTAAQFVLVTLLAGAVAGCIFEPRTPEPPTSGVSISYLQQTEARNAWQNLQISLNNTDPFGWTTNISTEFRYIPIDDEAASFPALNDWSYDREVAFINALFASGVRISSVMRNEDFTVPDQTGDSVEWQGVVYFVDVTSTVDNSSTRYSASARIVFHLEGNFWYIYEWEDLQGQSDPDSEGQLSSMGVLRGNYASK